MKRKPIEPKKGWQLSPKTFTEGMRAQENVSFLCTFVTVNKLY